MMSSNPTAAAPTGELTPQQQQQQQQQWLAMQQQYQQQWMAMQQYPAAAVASMAMQQQQHLMYQQPQYMPYYQQQQQQQYQQASQGQIQSSSEDNKTIWIGDLQIWMDEHYLQACFAPTGEAVSVKLIRNKQTGQSERFGFIEFLSHAAAEKILQSYNGTLMPNTDQAFRLNWATFSTGERRQDAGSDQSIFVRDLASDVTDTILHETFASRYSSVRGAKVVVDTNTGRSRGYGFVRFGDENERLRAMTEMNGQYCSSRPMSIGVATPKKLSTVPQQYPSQARISHCALQLCSKRPLHFNAHIAFNNTSAAANGALTQGSQSDGDTSNTTVFVGGLDSEVGDEELRHTFSQFGEVISVKIPIGKGCGFVQFADRTSAEVSIEQLNGTVIGKQTVRLSWGRNPGNKQEIGIYGPASTERFEKMANYSEELSTVPPGQKDSEAEEMEVQLDFQESYYNLFDIEEFLRLLKDLESNVLESKHVLVRNLKVMDIWVSKLSEIPNNLSFPDLEKLFLYTNSDSKNIPDSFFKGRPVVHYSNLDLSYIPPSFFERMPPSLTELNLTDSRMKTLPPSVLKLINLERLILKGCAQLIEIPHNISALENLTALDLTGCTNLVELPESFKQLKNLYSLDLTNCKSLTGLPSSFSGAKSLLSLSLSGCETFAEIPESFEFPRDLNSLNLTDCKRLTKVPESVCRLQFLNYLSLSGCENLATFPESFGKLQKLCTLELRDCKRLTRLPESLGMLTGLQILDLHGCTNLAEIPEAIESLKRLTSLDLSDCESLTKLPESISEIPFLGNIKLSGCSSLVEFHGPQVSVKCLSWNIGEPNQKQVELDFHETQGTPSDIAEILGLMEKVLQHQLLKSEELEVAVIKLKVIHTSKSKVPEIPKKLRFPDLEKLVLQPDIVSMISSITSSFFKRLPTFKVLDMSHNHIKTLPSCVYELTDLKGLILQRCELLIELPDGIGALENLELLDLEGTDLVCLPNELGKLINLKCLKVSLYDDESYRKRKKIIDIIPTAALSKLTKLEELSINFDPQDVWCNALVKAIIADMRSLRKLKTLKLYLPTTELLQNLMELKSNEDDLSIHKNLSNFTVIIGPHGQRFISRLPCDLEEEYLKLKKCLKYIGGKNTSEFADALKHANALYLDRHWNIQKLSVFNVDELNKLKFCMLVDCNEMQMVFDASDFSLEDNILSLQYLAIHYLKNLEEIGKGPSVGCCLQALKVLVLHMCPNLTTIFTQVLLGDLVNLEEIIVEDCAKITSLIAKDSTQLNGTEYLPRLKKMTLLYLPKLESISSGISIGPELENVIIYDCPKLKTLPSVGVRNEEVIKIKGEGEWWNALEWIGGRPQYLHNAFSELDIEGDFLDELATQYVNSLRLFVECNAD